MSAREAEQFAWFLMVDLLLGPRAPSPAFVRDQWTMGGDELRARAPAVPVRASKHSYRLRIPNRLAHGN
jgi:hypothetical protein